MKKTMKIGLLTACLTLATTIVSFGGWNQNERGWWYTYDDGSYPVSAQRTIDGKNYAFDAEGYMLTGWHYLSFNWLYFEPTNGEQVFGWRQIDGTWYFLDPEKAGAMHTSWLNIGADRYYMNENGALQLNLFYLRGDNEDSEYAYQSDPVTGVLFRNMIHEGDGITYKFDEYGIMTYRNIGTRLTSKQTGRDAWQYVTHGLELERQNLENATFTARARSEEMNDRYEKYQENVRTKSGSDRDAAYASWESITRRNLSENVYMSEDDINEFISRVTNGSYREVELPEIDAIEDFFNPSTFTSVPANYDPKNPNLYFDEDYEEETREYDYYDEEFDPNIH